MTLTLAPQALATSRAAGNASLAGCAVVVLEVLRGEAGDYFLVVDGADGAEEGALELTLLCELLLYPSEAPTPLPSAPPSMRPTPQPTATPAPSEVPLLEPTPLPTPAPTSAPTGLPARSNCACFSEKMVESLVRYCPKLSAHFVEGCMPNVTRAVLKSFADNCTALRADWGPYFANADDDYGSVVGYPFYS